MVYPGNPELAQEMQRRLLEAFDEALDLTELGRREEARLGCDFVLRTDPQFTPAQRLLKRLDSDAREIATSDLRLRETLSGEGISAVSASWGSLDGLELPPLSAKTGSHSAHQPVPAIAGTIRALLAERRDQEAVELGMQHAGEISSDAELLHELEGAQSRLEAAPYIAQFVEAARAAAAAGDEAERNRWLAKIRRLDPEHPELSALGGEIVEPPALTGLAFTPIHTFDFSPEIPPEGPAAETRAASAVDAEAASVAAALERALTPPPLQILAPARDEKDDRIVALLDEGQAAYERGEFQAAIDAWSRIFLIDIDHAEAGNRIEQARRYKAEADRQVEEHFHAGVAKFEAGDREGARTVFEQILRLQPSYLAAREYLTQIDSASSVSMAALPRLPGSAPVSKPEGATEARTSERPKARPRAASAPAAEQSPRPVKRRFRPTLVAGIAGIVGLAAIGWYVYQQRDRLFPNAGAQSVTPQPSWDPIARAQKMHTEGKSSAAIGVLRRIPASDPQFERAKALIAEWERLQAPARQGPSPETVRRQSEILARARSAFGERRFRLAAGLFSDAAQIYELPGDASLQAAEARQHVGEIARQIEMFQQGSWEEVLPMLWRLREADPNNRDVNDLLADSYVNLAIRELQREAPAEALANFHEAQAVRAADADIKRLTDFAESYRGRRIDLQYRIFVKYLSFRT
jgi:tetratricopeptide (TPR) repeat protein